MLEEEKSQFDQKETEAENQVRVFWQEPDDMGLCNPGFLNLGIIVI